VGRLSPEKNLFNLIRAIAMLKKYKRMCTLSIVGEGPCLKGLKALADELGVQGRVTFFGHIAHGSSLARIFDVHTFFCLPSYTEGTPRGVAEAIARKLPVIATDVGSVQSMFPGYLVKIRGFLPQDIYDAIVFSVESLELVRCNTLNAFKTINRYTIEGVASEAITLIESK